RPDVVEASSGRLLELGPGEVRPVPPFVDRADRGLLGEDDEPLRPAPELRERLRAEVLLEELDGDRGRDDPGERDTRQEERRQAEGEAPHGRRSPAGAGSASFAGVTL